MSVTNCSREEIEKKRLLAVQRKKEALLRHKLHETPNKKFKSSYASSSSNFKLAEDTQPNTSKSFTLNRFNQSIRGKFLNNSPAKSMKNNFNSQINLIKTKNFFAKKTRITVKIYMISDNRFALETSSFFSPVIDTIKTVQSRSYDLKTKTWNFLLQDYEILIEKIACFKSDIEVIELPKKSCRKRVNLENISQNVDLSNIDPVLLENLMPFQRDGICYGVSKNGCCMIADDMGLGKTIQALGIAHYFRENWPLLIVVPSSVRYQWAEAIYTFLPSIPGHYVHHFENAKDFVDNEKILITSYDLLKRAIDAFERRFFGFIILDESHVLKNVNTARYTAIKRVVSHARHVLLLSGTPALSRPIELYSQIRLIMPDFLGLNEYGLRYCAGVKSAFGFNYSGSSNLQELQMLLKHSCMIRRLKTEVLNQLPKKTREIIMLDPHLIKVGTREMAEKSKKLEEKNLSGTERHQELMQYYRESSFAKVKAVCDYISKLFEERRKCLIFAHHQHVLDAICDLAESQKIKYIRIDGKTNPERRKQQVDIFQARDDYLGAILSITAANAGITLTAAQLVVFAELFWNPGILCQAEDRVHRIGQNENVLIQYLVAKHTADDYLWPLIQKKLNVLNKAGLDHDFSLNDANVTSQERAARQKTLDYFLNSQEINDITHLKIKEDENLEQSNENAVKNITLESSPTRNKEDIKELLELDVEDLYFGEWNGEMV